MAGTDRMGQGVMSYEADDGEFTIVVFDSGKAQQPHVVRLPARRQ
jgi:hypothetical protein